MYGKIFAQMYDGTLGTNGPWQALVTFQQMIVLADKDGTVDMTAEALSRRTTIPVEIITHGLAELEKADTESRTPDEDGRRIVRVSDDRPWGWRIVNYDKYRKIRSEEDRRAYQREYWRTKRSPGALNTELNTSTPITQTQPIVKVKVKAEADTNNSTAHAERFGNPDQLTAYQELRKAASLGTSFDAGLTAVALPPSGGQAYSWVTIGRALGDFYAANGAVRMTPAALRAFCRRIESDDARPADQLPRGTSKQERGRAALAETLRRRGYTNGLDSSHHEISSTIPRALPDPRHQWSDG